METEAKEVLAQLVQRALDGVDAAVEFSQQQVPEVVEQLLMWHAIESVIWGAIGLAMFAVYPAIFKVLKRVAKKEDEIRGDFLGAAILGGLGSFFYLVVAILFAGRLITAFKIWLAPKLYLLEYGVSLVK